MKKFCLLLTTLIALTATLSSTAFGQAPPSFTDLGNIGPEGQFEFTVDGTFFDANFFEDLLNDPVIGDLLDDPIFSGLLDDADLSALLDDPIFTDLLNDPLFSDLSPLLTADTALALFDAAGNLLAQNSGLTLDEFGSQIIRNLADGEYFLCFSLDGATFDDGFVAIPPLAGFDPETLSQLDFTDFDSFNLSLNGVILANGGPDLAGDIFTGLEFLRIEVGSGIAALLGDVNEDGVVDFLDISDFISVLATTGFQGEADMDLNGTVDLLDIQPFINALLGL